MGQRKKARPLIRLLLTAVLRRSFSVALRRRFAAAPLRRALVAGLLCMFVSVFLCIYAPGLWAFAAEAETAGTPANTAAATEAETEAAGTPANAAGASAQDAGSAGIPTNTAAATTQETEKPYQWPLLSKEGIRISLMEVLSFSDGQRLFLLRCENSLEEDLTIKVEDVRLNGRIRVSGYEYFYADAGSDRENKSQNLSEAVLQAERDGQQVTKIACKITVTSWRMDENFKRVCLCQEVCEASIPEDFSPQLVCEPTLSMHAGEQLLRDDAKARITLLGLGRYPGSGSYDKLQGILKVDNPTDAPIPVYVRGIMLNNCFFSVYGSSQGTIPPGKTIYTGFSCSSSALERAGIRQVSEAALQIMTSENENTGTFSLAGGSWYPVVLDMKAGEEEITREGETVYEDDRIRILLNSVSERWDPDYSFIRQQYEWRFTVVNKTGRDLEVVLTDFTADGEDDENIIGYYYMYCSVGKKMRAAAALTHYQDEHKPLPEISFRVQVRSLGGGTMYSYSKKRTTITRELAEALMK